MSLRCTAFDCYSEIARTLQVLLYCAISMLFADLADVCEIVRQTELLSLVGGIDAPGEHHIGHPRSANEARMRTAPADEDAPVAFRQGIEGRGSATRTCCRRQFETSTAADPMYTAMTGAGPNLESELQQDSSKFAPLCNHRHAARGRRSIMRRMTSAGCLRSGDRNAVSKSASGARLPQCSSRCCPA